MEDKEVVDLVKRFLRIMEARDLDSAESMMASGAKITFPGGKEISSLQEMVVNIRGRYEWIKKNFDQIDVQKVDEVDVVYVMGTLYGVNNNGVAFSNVRYIDRFVVEKGLINQQDVWNDLAESGVLDMKE